MRRDAVSYVYKDFGAGHFGDVEVDFDFEITATFSLYAGEIICCISNTIGTQNDLTVANDGIIIVSYTNAGNIRISIFDYNLDNSDHYYTGGTTSPHLYCTFKRIGSTATLDLYSDSDRTTLVDALSITCETGSKRYFYALASRAAANEVDDTQTGYVQNFEIIGSSNESPSESPSLSPSESPSLSPSASESPSEGA